MGSQNGPVSRYIMSHKLAEDRPTSRGVSQGLGGVVGRSAIAETACATERVQELLIGLKRRELGKHPSVVRGASGCIDCRSSARRRQAVISDRGGGLIHESLHSSLRCLFRGLRFVTLYLSLGSSRLAP